MVFSISMFSMHTDKQKKLRSAYLTFELDTYCPIISLSHMRHTECSFLAWSLSTLTMDFSSAAAYLVKRKTSLMIMMAEVRQSPAMCDVTECRNSTTANDSAAVNRPVIIFRGKILLGFYDKNCTVHWT